MCNHVAHQLDDMEGVMQMNGILEVCIRIQSSALEDGKLTRGFTSPGLNWSP